MKKSNSLLILILVNSIVFFVTDSSIQKFLMTITATILTVGYFIVKQLEENNQ